MDLKLGRITQIAHSVSDVDAAEAFYEQKLGLKKLYRPSPDMVFFDLGGVRLYLNKAHAEFTPEKASILYLLCEDISAAVAELKGRGVAFEDEPHRLAEMPTHDLWMAFFKDPDGHLIGLEMQAPKGWTPA